MTATEVQSEEVSSQESGGENLQEQMTGNFFDDVMYDDGVDAVVDANGNTKYDSEGNAIRSLEDYKKMAGEKPAAEPKTGEGDEVKTSLPGFDKAFTKEDGSFDFDGMMKTTSGLKDYSYEMRSRYKVPEGGVQSPQNVDPKERIRTSIDELRTKLTTERIEPIKRLYESIDSVYRAAGQGMPDEVYAVINKAYTDSNNDIATAIDQKRDELFTEAFESKSSKAEEAEFQKKGIENFRSIADKMLPGVEVKQREDKLSELVFGHQDEKGNWVNGFGSDIINMLFDEAMQGKQFQSAEEWKQSYNNWWNRFASDPTRLQTLVGMSFKGYVASNHGKYRDEYRKAWEADQSKKLKTPKSNSGALTEMDSGEDLLHNYHTKL